MVSRGSRVARSGPTPWRSTRRRWSPAKTRSCSRRCGACWRQRDGLHPCQRSGGGVAFGVRGFEVVADEVVDLLLARIGRSERRHVLAKGLIVARIFSLLGSLLTPLVVLLPDVRVLGSQVLKSRHNHSSSVRRTSTSPSRSMRSSSRRTVSETCCVSSVVRLPTPTSS